MMFYPKTITPEFFRLWFRQLKIWQPISSIIQAFCLQRLRFAIRNIENPIFLINYVCVNFGLNVKEKIHLLEIDEILERGYQLLELLNKESQLL